MSYWRGQQNAVSSLQGQQNEGRDLGVKIQELRQVESEEPAEHSHIGGGTGRGRGAPCTRSTTVTETPHDDWCVSWRMAVLLLPGTLVGLVAFGYKCSLRSDLRAPNWKLFQVGELPQILLVLVCLRMRHHQCPPNHNCLLTPRSDSQYLATLRKRRQRCVNRMKEKREVTTRCHLTV